MTEESSLSFSVVIPTLWRPERLRRTLQSVAQCVPGPDEVVVIDGDEEGSSRPVVEALRRVLPIRYEQTGRGSSRQRNYGIDRVGGNVIVFFDDDVDVSPDAFGVLRDAFSDPDVVAVAGRIIENDPRRSLGKHSRLRRFLPGGGAEGSFTRYGYPRRLIHLDEPRDVSFMEGSFMSVRAAAAREVRFDENLAGYGLAEDEDFSYRLSKLGRIVYQPKAWVDHDRSGSGGADARRFGKTVVVNRHYLFKKNFPQTARARVQFAMLIVLLLFHRVVNREWQGALGILDGARAIWLPKT